MDLPRSSLEVKTLESPGTAGASSRWSQSTNLSDLLSAAFGGAVAGVTAGQIGPPDEQLKRQLRDSAKSLIDRLLKQAAGNTIATGGAQGAPAAGGADTDEATSGPTGGAGEHSPEDATAQQSNPREALLNLLVQLGMTPKDARRLVTKLSLKQVEQVLSAVIQALQRVGADQQKPDIAVSGVQPS